MSTEKILKSYIFIIRVKYKFWVTMNQTLIYMCVCGGGGVWLSPMGQILDWVPQFTCILGQEYPTIGGPKDGEAVSIGDRRKFFFLFGFLSCIPTLLENVTMWLALPYEIWIGLLSPREVIFLTSRVSLSPIFPTPYPLPISLYL